MKHLKALLALFASTLAMSAALAGTTPVENAQPTLRVPVYLVSSTVGSTAVLLQYYTPRPREQFCVAYTGVRVDIGAAWQHMPQCVTSDQYGAASVRLLASGEGTLVVSVVLPEGETRSDVLQLGALRKNSPRK